jgi:hypothetical protein
VGLAVHAFREARETEIESQRLDFQSLRAAGLAGLAISMDELRSAFRSELRACRLAVCFSRSAFKLSWYPLGELPSVRV